jgi:hypothetical protein
MIGDAHVCIADGVIPFLMIRLLVTFNSPVNYRNRADSALSAVDVM